MDVIQRFADLALEYREWVLHGTDSGPKAVRMALRLVTRLYAAALDLPPLWTGDRSDVPPPPVPEKRDVYRSLGRRLPLQLYGEVFNPLPVPPEQPVIGDVADDLADVFFDVDGGLRWFEIGHTSEAVWEWGFFLVHHWGEHSTGVIRALHCWLVEHHPELLATPVTRPGGATVGSQG